jgi:hypothetical protein
MKVFAKAPALGQQEKTRAVERADDELEMIRNGSPTILVASSVSFIRD